MLAASSGVTVKVAANLAGVHPDTIRNWIERRWVRSDLTPDRHRRVSREVSAFRA